MHAFRPWRGLAAFAALFCANVALAATTFNGGAVPSGCTYDAPTKTYSCSSLPTAQNEVITIASTYRVNVTGAFHPSWNQTLVMSGTAILSTSGNMDLTDIDPSHVQATGGTLITGGTFSISGVNPLNANVNAAQAVLGGGGAMVINGNVVSTGTLVLNSNARVNGNVSGTVITSTSPATFNGNVTASTSFDLASNSTVTGNITAPNVTLRAGGGTTVTGTITATGTVSVGSNAVITGDVNTGNLQLAAGSTTINGNVSATGSVYVGSNADVNGDVVAGGTVTMEPGSTTINGSVSASSVSMGSGAVITEPVTCSTANNGQTCGCVQGSSTPVQCAPPPATAPHHIQITHPGSGLTCQPTTVSITACANAACTAPHYSNGVTVTLNPGGQAFVVGSTGVYSTATVQRTTPGTGIALSASSTASNASTCVRTSDNTTNCGFNFVDTGFQVSIPNHKAGAIATMDILAIRKDTNTGACTTAFTNTPRNLTFTCAYDNPTSGTVTPTVNGQAIGTSCTGGSVTMAVPFTAGAASRQVVYPDVGKVKMTVAYTGSSATGDFGLSMTGFNYFIAAPDRMEVRQIATVATPVVTQATLTTPGTSRFIGAGEPFTISVAALTTGGAVAPNFGSQTPPEAVAIMPVTYVAGYPAGGAAVTIDPVVGAPQTFSGGVALTTRTVNDVGTAAFYAKLSSGNFMASGVAAPTDSVTNYIGRVGPSYFDTEIVTGGTMACPSPASTIATCAATAGLVYSQQPFSVKVTARTQSGGVAANFRGSFAAQVDLTAWNAIGGATQLPPATNPVSTFGPFSAAATDFAAGIATKPVLYKAGVLTAPTTVAVRAIGDGATSKRAAGTVEGAVTVVNGRLALDNNYGSERLTMPIMGRVQYWNGTRWTLSSTDSASTLLPTMFDLTLCTGKLKQTASSACNAFAAVSGTPSSVRVNGGTIRTDEAIRLSAPGAGNTGSVDIALKPGVADFLIPPTGVSHARGVFGVYRSPIIYQREVY